MKENVWIFQVVSVLIVITPIITHNNVFKLVLYQEIKKKIQNPVISVMKVPLKIFKLIIVWIKMGVM